MTFHWDHLWVQRIIPWLKVYPINRNWGWFSVGLTAFFQGEMGFLSEKIESHQNRLVDHCVFLVSTAWRGHLEFQYIPKYSVSLSPHSFRQIPDSDNSQSWFVRRSIFRDNCQYWNCIWWRQPHSIQTESSTKVLTEHTNNQSWGLSSYFSILHLSGQITIIH